MEHLTLYFRHGSSDKIYQASIVPKDDGYVAQFQYGRRGSALQSEQKNTVFNAIGLQWGRGPETAESRPVFHSS